MNEADTIGVYALEILFAAGVLGSVLVVLLSMIEDFEVWFTPKDADGSQDDASAPPDLATT